MGLFCTGDRERNDVASLLFVGPICTTGDSERNDVALLGVIRLLGGDDVMMGGDATSSTYQSEMNACSSSGSTTSSSGWGVIRLLGGDDVMMGGGVKCCVCLRVTAHRRCGWRRLKC